MRACLRTRIGQSASHARAGGRAGILLHLILNVNLQVLPFAAADAATAAAAATNELHFGVGYGPRLSLRLKCFVVHFKC